MSHKLLSLVLCLSMMILALPAVAQDANGAGTRSAIPSTRNKPGLRSEGKKEDKKDKKEAAQQDGGKAAEGEGEGEGKGEGEGEQGGATKANGAGTRSAIPSTRNKPGLRHETQPDDATDKEAAAEQQDQTAKAAE